MATTLTKAMRADIVEAIYKASKLPKQLEELHKLPKEKYRELVLASRPEGFAEMIQGRPKEWFNSECETWNHRYYRVEGAGKSRMDEDEIGMFASNCISLDDPVLIPAIGSADFNGQLGEWMHKVYRPKYMAWAKKREELRNAAFGVLNSYRTVEKLLKDAPEFEQFIPDKAKSYSVPMVPVSNALATFIDAGIELKKV